MTASIERAFGSKHMAAGVLLNNQLTDFSFLPIKDGKPVANAAQAYKRPRSTMSPTIVYDADGKPVLAIGSPGGSRIAGYTIKVILGVFGLEHAYCGRHRRTEHRFGARPRRPSNKGPSQKS